MKKSTKKSLLLSILALVLCTAMLLGTTFAWFTDSASTAVNKIQAGTLDIQLLDASGNSLEGQVLNWQKAAGHEREEVLWEPGCTYKLQPITIKNNGNLALKYKIEITGIQGDAELNEAIDWTIENDGQTYAINQEVSLAADAEDTLTISGTMKTTAGNEYQNKSIDGIAITVLATQDTVEYDSNNNQYDAQAVYPVAANTQAELNDAIASAQNGSDIPTKVALPKGEFKLENATAQNKNITISGTKDTVVTVVGDSGNQMNYQNGATLAFEGVTIKGQTDGDFGGIAHVTETTFVNCTFEGKLTLYGDAKFINCTFKNDSDYAIWTWGAKNAEFIGCTFNSGGKAILLYGGAGSTEAPTTNLTVTDCRFIDNGHLDTSKAAIETGNDYNAVYNLTVNNITVTGFAVNPEGTSTGSNIWANKNSMDAAHLNVVINGVDVY